ncbi:MULTISPECIES: polysaccharide deacetylase family protein [Methylosinus]|uniref:Chitooligosaccharide deacetylase n=1 Tax=Methylosinus trichosporium (strain ATCC 35070 / NCIMB 11131 / UNIQEM 75 / OB3b) TaxID=595536 RepID=A0A2D2CZX6_METT3|nr:MULTISPECIES: polysaccharide deacetylase family protein [Methylosinus]ATQ68285.1 polysaccharide deacetylase family protein [Methylosinus trichosporium OB3b]OBS50975.1 polysaccharide deacetylase [Methylosinus sp. 3S-1]
MSLKTRLLPLFLGLFTATAAAAAARDCGPQALGVAREIVIDGGQRLALGLETYPRTLALADHEVVLTFDDGPVAGPTDQVLDALKAECARATFFLIGRHAAEAPALVRRIIADGHNAGYHSYSHPARTLRLMSDESARVDIDKGIAAVDAAGFGAAGPAPRTPFFRFPGFADTPELVSWLEDRSIAVFGADLWASDWQEMTPQAELALVMSRLEAARKGIVLFHDPRGSTARMMPQFLRALKERGFRLVHLVPGRGPTPIEEAKPGWRSATEAIIAKTLGPKGQRREPQEGRGVKTNDASPR